jgi:hypothetical protein
MAAQEHQILSLALPLIIVAAAAVAGCLLAALVVLVGVAQVELMQLMEPQEVLIQAVAAVEQIFH